MSATPGGKKEEVVAVKGMGERVQVDRAMGGGGGGGGGGVGSWIKQQQGGRRSRWWEGRERKGGIGCHVGGGVPKGYSVSSNDSSINKAVRRVMKGSLVQLASWGCHRKVHLLYLKSFIKVTVKTKVYCTICTILLF